MILCAQARPPRLKPRDAGRPLRLCGENRLHDSMTPAFELLHIIAGGKGKVSTFSGRVVHIFETARFDQLYGLGHEMGANLFGALYQRIQRLSRKNIHILLQDNPAVVYAGVDFVNGHPHTLLTVIKLPEVGHHAPVFGKWSVMDVDAAMLRDLDQTFLEDLGCGDGNNQVQIHSLQSGKEGFSVDSTLMDYVYAVVFAYLCNIVTAIGSHETGCGSKRFVSSVSHTHSEEIEWPVKVIHLAGKLEGGLFGHCLAYNDTGYFVQSGVSLEELLEKKPDVEWVILGYE